MYTLYILRCQDNSLYTGITNNLEQRIKKHQDGKGSKYVRAHAPFTLVYTLENLDKSTALKMEAKIKKLPKNKKELLIKNNNIRLF